LTWWFEPWRYADEEWWVCGAPPNLTPQTPSIVARRRTYRFWCEQLGLQLLWTGPIDEAWCSIVRLEKPVGALRLLGAAVMASASPARRAPPDLSHADWQWALQCAMTGSLGQTANIDDLSLVGLDAIHAAVSATSPCLLSRVMLIFPPALVRMHTPAIEPMPSAAARRVRRVWAAARSRSEEA
jgi:hypothetical protein